MKEVRVVLADDHALMRAGLRDALNRLPGLETVGEAGNGSDLLRELDRSRPDLLVVDVNMPEFEPVSAIRYICANYPAMKILVVSAYDDQAHVVGLLAAGVNGYHLKDQPLSDFNLAVQRVLDGGRWISDPLVNRLVDQHLTPTETTPLTRRQRELLYFLTQGYNNQKIARVLNLSIKTVENHLTALYKAINVEGRLEASNYGSRHPELISIPGQGKIDDKLKWCSTEELKVLIVDDNPRYRAQLGKLVKRACPTCSLYEAEDAVEAYQIAEQVKLDMAFIDVVLKDEDGIQCVRRIRAISETTNIILISAYPDWGFRQAGQKAGAMAFLDKKDIDAATVYQMVEDTLGH